jgi:hypothetical protein
MKIRMLTSMAGADFALNVGDETERFPDKEAARMIEAGYAVPVSDPTMERTTKKAAPEKRG